MKPSNAAKLPGIPAVTQSNLLQVVQALVERSEVREGARGNPFERAVTVRELKDMGFTGFGGGYSGSNQTGSVLTVNPDGTYSAMSPDAFADSIRKSKLYHDLMKRLDDATRFDDLPEQIRAILLKDIAAEAAKRGADIQRVEYKLQSATESLAYTVEEVTASVAGSMAGVRETVFASAAETNATAGKVTQLVASLDGTGSATIEESLAVIANRTDGLTSQYMLKLNAGKAVTGFGLLASEDPTGLTESKFIIQADQFALTGTYTYMQGDMSSTPPVAEPSAAVAGQTWYNTRTNLSYRAAGGVWTAYIQPIPFGVDMTTNTTYINGQLRVGSAGGVALDDVVAGSLGTSTAIGYAYKRSATDLIAVWNATTNGPGAVTWTFASGSITTPATDALGNGWTKSIPNGTDPLYVTVCTAANTTATDSIADTEWATPALLTKNGTDGSNGLNVATAILYQRNASATVGPTAQANTVAFTFATGAMSGMSAGWTTAIPAASSGAYLWVTRATASGTGATDTLATGEWSAPVLYTQDGINGTNGTRGTIVAKITGAWDATTAAAAVSAIATAAGSTPTTPIKGDIVYYTGGANECTVAGSPGTWGAVAAYIDGSLVVSGTISGTQISATAIDGKTITGATMQTSASSLVDKYVISGSSIVGYDATDMVRTQIDCHIGYGYFKNTTSTAAVNGLNTGTGLAGSFSAISGSAILAYATSGYGAELRGNATQSPLALGALTATPSSAVNGDIYCNNSATVANRGLYAYVSGAWVNISKNVTTKSGGNNILFEWANPNLQIYVDASLVATFNVSTKVWS